MSKHHDFETRLQPHVDYGLIDDKWEESDSLAIVCHKIFAHHFEQEKADKWRRPFQDSISHYLANLEGKSPSLQSTRQELKKIQRLSYELYKLLSGIGPPAEMAIENFLEDHLPSKYLSLHPETLSKNLNMLAATVNNILAMMPKSGGWPDRIKPETQLILDLAHIYTQETGKSPADGNKRVLQSHDGHYQYFYDGPFYKLVEDITLAIGSRKQPKPEKEHSFNQALGKAIDRALEDVPDTP